MSRFQILEAQAIEASAFAEALLLELRFLISFQIGLVGTCTRTVSRSRVSPINLASFATQLDMKARSFASVLAFSSDHGLDARRSSRTYILQNQS